VAWDLPDHQDLQDHLMVRVHQVLRDHLVYQGRLALYRDLKVPLEHQVVPEDHLVQLILHPDHLVVRVSKVELEFQVVSVVWD
jgi:hypothetical protein